MMENNIQNRPHFDENKNYLDDDKKPLFNKQKVIEEKVVIRRIRKQFLSYKEAEIIYSLQHKKLLEMGDACGALYRDGNTVRINRDIFDAYFENFHQPAGMYGKDGRREVCVGCVCAEKMSGDYENPRKAENAMKSRLLRKKNFLKKPWKYNSLKGSYSKKYKGTYITLVKTGYGSWGIYCDKYRLWQVNGQKIKDFKAAEALAFELHELGHRPKEKMAA